jgi:hypothetical protein
MLVRRRIISSSLKRNCISISHHHSRAFHVNTTRYQQQQFNQLTQEEVEMIAHKRREKEEQYEQYSKRPKLFYLFVGATIACAVVGPALVYYLANEEESNEALLAVGSKYSDEDAIARALNHVNNIYRLAKYRYFSDDLFDYEFAKRLIYLLKESEYVVHEKDRMGGFEGELKKIDPVIGCLAMINAMIKMKKTNNMSVPADNLIDADVLPVLFKKLEEAGDSKIQGVISLEELNSIADQKKTTPPKDGYQVQIDFDDPSTEAIVKLISDIHSDPEFHDRILVQKDYLDQLYSIVLDSKYSPLRENASRAIARLVENEIKYPKTVRLRISNQPATAEFLKRAESRNATEEANVLKQLLQADLANRKSILSIRPEDISMTDPSEFSLSLMFPIANLYTVPLLIGYVAIRWRFKYKVDVFHNDYFKKKVIPSLIAYGVFKSQFEDNIDTITAAALPLFYEENKVNGRKSVQGDSMTYFAFSSITVAAEMLIWLTAYRYARFVFLPTALWKQHSRTAFVDDSEQQKLQ